MGICRLIALMRTHGTFVEKRLVPKLYAFVTVNSSLSAHFNRRYRLPQKRSGVDEFTGRRMPVFRKKWILGPVRGGHLDDQVLIYQGVLNEGRGLTLLIDTLPLVPQTVKWSNT